VRKLGFQNTGRYRAMGQNRLPAGPAVNPTSDATRAERRVPCETRRRLLSEITAPLEAQLRPKKGRRLRSVAAGATRRLVLVVSQPFAGLALPAFALLALPPIERRAISAPEFQTASYRANPSFWKRRIGLGRRLPTGWLPVPGALLYYDR
jgi:hypothetical protein